MQQDTNNETTTPTVVAKMRKSSSKSRKKSSTMSTPEPELSNSLPIDDGSPGHEKKQASPIAAFDNDKKSSPPVPAASELVNSFQDDNQGKENEQMPLFTTITENIYLVERKKSKSKKEAKRMVCNCELTKEEIEDELMGCGDDCLNRIMMMECGSRCTLGDYCANKRFLRKQYAKVEPFKTAKKGWGLRSLQPLSAGSFIMEYVGEVIGLKEFRSRVRKYEREKHEHHFFMALKSDEIIDSTHKGNVTRFINHSCDPNSETQKWTVSGEMRIGFFTKRNIAAGEEITFDYQLMRYGKIAQRCYCESENCRGYIGSNDVSELLEEESENFTNDVSELLKDAYRIPRLERPKRHEDEKEADRKALESDEKNLRNSFVYLDNKIRVRLHAEEQNSLRRPVKRPFEPSSYGKRPYINGQHYQQIQQNSADGSSKISKEEHRVLYNAELMRKEYEETLKYYRIQLDAFTRAVQQLVEIGYTNLPLPPPRPPPPPTSLNLTGTPELSNMLSAGDGLTPRTPNSQYGNDWSNQKATGLSTYNLSNGLVNYESINTNKQSSHLDDVFNQQPQRQSSEERTTPIPPAEDNADLWDSSSIQSSTEAAATPVTVTSQNRNSQQTLIELSNNDHQLMLDAQAVILTDYGVELIPNDINKRKQQDVNLFNQTYPSPGTYFVNDEHVYFVPCQFNPAVRKLYNFYNSDQFLLYNLQTTVIEHIPHFLLPCKEECKMVLPPNWKSARDQRNGYVYYYNTLTKHVQWNFPLANSEDALSTTDVTPENTSSADGESGNLSQSDNTGFEYSALPDAQSLQKIRSSILSINQDGQNTPDENLINNKSVQQHTLSVLPSSSTSLITSSDNTPLDSVVIKKNIDLIDNERRNAGGSNHSFGSLRLSSERRKPTQQQKERFKIEVSEHVKACLNSYRKESCKVGRILCSSDFKHVARKLTNEIFDKEVNNAKSAEHLKLSDSKKIKTREYIKKYMSKFKVNYKPDAKEDLDGQLDDNEDVDSPDHNGIFARYASVEEEEDSCQNKYYDGNCEPMESDEHDLHTPASAAAVANLTAVAMMPTTDVKFDEIRQQQQSAVEMLNHVTSNTTMNYYDSPPCYLTTTAETTCVAYNSTGFDEVTRIESNSDTIDMAINSATSFLSNGVDSIKAAECNSDTLNSTNYTATLINSNFADGINDTAVPTKSTIINDTAKIECISDNGSSIATTEANV